MRTLHLCNVNFEWELEHRSQLSIKESLLVHPTFLQLQFLPFLYAKEGDGVVVTQHLETAPEHLNIHLFEEKIEGYDTIETWGWSEAVARWTSLPYTVPKHLRDLASKAFAFNHSPNLPGARLLRQKKEVHAFLSEDPYPKVIKSCYGLAGRGRWILQKGEEPPRIAYQEFDKGHQLIGEPWVNRSLDFSTQWMLDDKITFLGSTVMENTESGVYNRTFIGRNIPQLDAHIDAAQIPLKELYERGYRGNVGIDAFLYEDTLHPIVEINLRKTMGWIALTLGKNIAFETGKEGLLPTFLDIGKKITFQKQLKLL